MFAGALGRPLRLIVTAGQTGDSTLAPKPCWPTKPMMVMLYVRLSQEWAPRR